MKKWEKALEKFIASWRDQDDVIGAIVAGSYVLGTQTPRSDIDVHIILADTAKWRERGNTVMDGYLFEYFANPRQQLEEYLKEDYEQGRRTDARMFTMGRVLFDKTGGVEKLKRKAQKEFIRSFKKLTRTRVELAKYQLWDQMDGLTDIASTNPDGFFHLHHLHLRSLIEIYARFLGAEIPSAAKISQYLSDSSFRRKYRIPAFPDKTFAKQISLCLTEKNKGRALSQITLLTEHVLKKMGGFEIDGWKVRSSLDK